MPTANEKRSNGPRRTAALLLLLAALGLGCATLAAAPPDLERYDPAKPPPEAERLQRIDQVRAGISPAQVRHLLGGPQRVARQILYHRYFEQWLYDAPFHLRVEFDCRQGQEPQVVSVRSTRLLRP
jgi:hypothetical protein